MVRPLRAAHHHLIWDDRPLAMQRKRLLRRQVPLIAETVVAVARAEFPERRIPGCAVARARSRAGGDQPAVPAKNSVRIEIIDVG